MMKKTKLLLLLLLSVGFFTLFHTGALGQGQTITISGVIVDATERPVSGATIAAQGTSHGDISDRDGKFSVALPNEAATLSITHIGYQPQTIVPGNRRSLKVVMSEDATELDKVVVVAYGVQKKVSVTGAISSVQSKELLKSSSVNLANSLGGRISGLSSMQTGGGQPGKDDATIYLRGAATTNGKSPLILIDGVPRSNIRTLDPNEVESVSVLKDASATAVFGVRGANGVILITTRRGGEGKAQLSINAYQSLTSFTRVPKFIGSVDYLNLKNEASLNDGNGLFYSKEEIEKYADPLAGLDPQDPDYARQAAQRRYMYPNHDWYRELIRKYTPQTTVSANLSGGTDEISYFINAGYVHQGGNLRVQPRSELGYNPEVKMDRYSFRSNLDYKVTKSLKAFLNLGTYIERVNMPSAGTYPGRDAAWMMRDLLFQATIITPITPGPTTIAGYGAPQGQVVFPAWMDRTAYEIMNRQGYRLETRTNLNSTLGLDWSLSELVTPGLSIKGMLSYDSYAASTMDAYKKEYLYLANVDTKTDQLSFSRFEKQQEQQLEISKWVSSKYTINAQVSINYTRTFNNRHNVGALVLAQRDYWETTGGAIPYNVLGIAGRVTYNFDNRYFGEFDMGYNGSEQFSPKKRFGFFPAFSAGWALSNEKFLKNNRVVTYLKIRGSWGQVGNDQMGSDRFLYQDHMKVLGGGFSGSLGRGQRVSEGLVGNPHLTWERASKFNVGVDFGIFKDLTGSVDFFIEKRDQILIMRNSIPAFQGVAQENLPRQNMGKVDNSGFEVELNYNKAITRDFSVYANGNFGFNRNTVKYFDEIGRSAEYTYRKRIEGFPLQQQWGYLINYQQDGGYWTEETLNDPGRIQYGSGVPRPGDFVYVDTNKDGVIDDKDIAPIGYSRIPGITYGFTVGTSFFGVDFSIFFQGAGRYSYFSGVGQNVYEFVKGGNCFEYQRTAWTKERFERGDKITYPALSLKSSVNQRANSFFVENRSFIRLKNIELGYTLPPRSLRSIGITKLRIYASAQNLVTWDKRTVPHLDPELDDPIRYPITKMMNFGVNITF